jgi:hypothetical protein
MDQDFAVQISPRMDQDFVSLFLFIFLLYIIFYMMSRKRTSTHIEPEALHRKQQYEAGNNKLSEVEESNNNSSDKKRKTNDSEGICVLVLKTYVIFYLNFSFYCY